MTSAERARQQALQARCAHPSGAFERFEAVEVEQSVAARFERVARRHPRRLAVKTASDAFTYEALNQAANRVAHALLPHVAADPAPVALLLRNGAAFVAAALGVAKAARIQVALDPAMPRARLEAMLAQAGADVVVTEAHHAALARELAGQGRRVLEVERLADGPILDPGLAVAPEAPLAISYTSGSTGPPKGVVLTHRNVLHNVMRHANTFRIGPDDRHLALAAATVAPLYALLVGAAVCPVDLPKVGLAGLAAWLVEQEVTVYRSAVSPFRGMVDVLRGGEQFPRLRLLMVFGEPVHHADLERYRKHFADECLFMTSLGTRETGDYAYFLADKALTVPPGVLPGGYPAEDLEVLILDKAGRRVPVGEPGELAVRSPHTAGRYWRRPDLTRAAYLADVVAGERGIYRTGDLGRQLPDGCLVHLGRRDFQVKIRGHRVDVGDVETALLEVPGVKMAVVAGREDNPGERRLVAYLLPSGEGLPTVGEMRRALAATLPAYMIPHAFVRVDALPLTATGKIDRRALPAPGPERPALDAPLAPPRTDLEATVTAIFADTLGLTQVGVHDGFFDLGGDSLLALRLVTEIDRRVGTRLPLALLLEAPTPAALAAILGQEGWTPPWTSLVAIQPGGTRVPLFCVPGHTGTILCFLELARRLGPDQPVYGLEPRGLDGRHPPQASIEEMAASYVEELRGFQSAGPYALAGYCFGGLVAFEMARRLRAAGETVAVVGLFDAVAPPGATGAPGAWRRRVAARVVVETANLAALGGRERAAYAIAGLRQVARRAAALVRRPRGPEERDEHVARVADAQSRAAAAYQPAAYAGAVVLYKARHPLTRHFVDADFGWRELVGEGLTVRLIASAGGSIIQDPVAATAVADDLRRRLPPT